MKNSIKNNEGLKIPIVDTEICKNCKACIDICPNSAISSARKDTCSKCMRYCLVYEVPCKPEKIVFDYEYCDSCGQCIDVCPEKAIRWFTVKNN